jgi:hypothetical protein
MNLDLTDEESAALIRELDRIIDDDRYPLSPRIMTLKAILAKLRPEPIRETSTQASEIESVSLLFGNPRKLPFLTCDSHRV